MFALTLDDAQFAKDADAALENFDRDVDKSAANAADEGIKAEQADHPYTDRTGNLTGSAHVEPADTGDGFGFDMVWPAPYAGFVNDGTSRAKPYPFVPIAEERAEQVLKYDLANAIDALKDKF